MLVNGLVEACTVNCMFTVGHSIQVSDEGRDQQPNYEVSLRPRIVCRQESQEDGTNNDMQRTDSFPDSRHSRSVAASLQRHHHGMLLILCHALNKQHYYMLKNF